MKKESYILSGLILTAALGFLTIWNFSADRAAARQTDERGAISVAAEYNARDEFALTQGVLLPREQRARAEAMAPDWVTGQRC